MGKQTIENIGKKLAVLIISFYVISTTAAVALAAGDTAGSGSGGYGGINPETGSAGSGSGGYGGANLQIIVSI